MPQISIIVPVYKVEKYIHKCIDSILSQTYKDWELILVDDGTPDNSGLICDEYAINDSRIQVIHQKNAGVGAARNAGIDKSTGKYIAFLDSDDFCTGDYLQNFVNGLIQNSDSDLIIQGMYFYDNGVTAKLQFSDSYYVDKIKDAILQNKLLSFGAPYCKLFKKEVIDSYSIHFATDYSFGEDTYFFFEYLSHARRIQFVSPLGYFYRDSPGDSLSKKCHRFEHLYLFANDSMRIISSLDKTREVEKAYSFTFIRLLIIGLLNTHKLGYTKKERFASMAKVKETRSIRLYSAMDLFHFLYIFLQYAPIWLSDKVFYCISKFKHI